MQKCKACKFRSIQTEQIRDDNGKVVMIQDRCQKCGHINKEKVIK